MSIKLSGLSLKELKILRTKVDLAVQKLEAKNLSKARIEVANLARDYGIPLEALIDKKAASKPALKPTKKLCHPNIGTQTMPHFSGLVAG